MFPVYIRLWCKREDGSKYEFGYATKYDGDRNLLDEHLWRVVHDAGPIEIMSEFEMPEEWRRQIRSAISFGDQL